MFTHLFVLNRKYGIQAHCTNTKIKTKKLAGLAVWGVINLLEGYGNDNPGAKSQGIKQLMAN